MTVLTRTSEPASRRDGQGDVTGFYADGGDVVALGQFTAGDDLGLGQFGAEQGMVDYFGQLLVGQLLDIQGHGGSLRRLILESLRFLPSRRDRLPG